MRSVLRGEGIGPSQVLRFENYEPKQYPPGCKPKGCNELNEIMCGPLISHFIKYCPVPNIVDTYDIIH